MASPEPLAHLHSPEQLANILSVIGKLLSVLNTEQPPKDIFRQIGQCISPLIPFDRLSISVAQLRFWYYLEDEEVTTMRDLGVFDETSSASTWVFIHKKPLLRKDITRGRQYGYDTELGHEKMRSDLILPLTIDSKIVGTFNFTSHLPNVYTPEHLNAARAISEAIAVSVKHLQTRQNLGAIQRIQEALLDTKDIDRIFNLLVRHLHMQYDRIRIYLYDPEKKALHSRFQGGILPLEDFHNIVLPLAQDPYSQETFGGTAPKIYQTDTPKQRWVQKSGAKGPHQWAEIPLRVNQEGKEIVVGKLSLDNVSTRVPLRQSDLDRTMIFVSQAALAIYQAQLRNEMANQVSQRTLELKESNDALQKRDTLLAALSDVSQLSLSYLDRDKILDNFGRHIIEAGIFRSLMIALVDHPNQMIEVVRSFQNEGKDPESGEFKIRNYDETCGTTYHLTDDNVTPLTARTGKLQLIETAADERLDKRYDKPDSPRWRNKVAYFIPVKREDRVLAVLATGSVEKEKDAILQNIHTMQPLLNQLGIALEHADLHGETQDTAAKLQKTNKDLLAEIQERQQTELALRESRQQYRTLFENMEKGFAYHEMVTDKEGNPVDYIFLEVNEAFEKLTGLKRADILNKRVTETLPGIERDPADWIGTYGRVALTGESIRFENYSGVIKRWFAVSAYSPQKGSFACVFEDITERKEADERMATLLAFQKEMLDTPVVWICAFDKKRNITFWNRAAENISGYTAEEALRGTQIWDKLYPDTSYLRQTIEESRKLIEPTGRLENYENTICCKNGAQKTISWQLNRLHIDDPESGYLTIGIDITHHKKLEEELVRMERLKALGELAAGVSHNLNNMLTGILGPAELLKLETKDPALLENIDDVLTSALRARDLVKQLNQVVRRDLKETLEAVDINTIIIQATRATSPRWKDEAESRGIHIAVETDLARVPPIAATESGLHDMLLNFIFNAVDAMPKGGTLTIQTQNTKEGTQLTVTDTGIGMNAETKRRIFEPFFTTKMDVGTGMGLATVHATIERWGATIEVQSSLTNGTSFKILFPHKAPDTIIQSPAVSSTHRSAHILIVEDDEIVCNVMHRLLSNKHEVTIVHTGDQAIKLAQTIRFDVAFIDLGLPDQPGDQVSRSLKSQNPNLYTILTTGWPLEDNDPRCTPFDDLLPKPAGPAKVYEALDKALTRTD